MIKVAIYEYEYEWDNEEPSKIVTLKEFEELFEDEDFRPSRIKFIVE